MIKIWEKKKTFKYFNTSQLLYLVESLRAKCLYDFSAVERILLDNDDRVLDDEEEEEEVDVGEELQRNKRRNLRLFVQGNFFFSNLNQQLRSAAEKKVSEEDVCL